MKLCFIAAANSIHSKKWIDYFVERGDEIHWISLVKPTQEINRDIKFYYLQSSLPINLINIKRLISKNFPDIIHAHYAGRNGFLASISGFHPFVLTVWGTDVLFHSRSLIKGPLVRYVLKKADLITCDAQHMQEAMVKLQVPLAKIKIIYFGIDTQKFSPAPKDVNLMRDIGKDSYKTVISLRSLNPVYNIETLIRAVPLVLAQLPRTKFIIIGEGSEENKLKALATFLKINGEVKFIGRIANNDIPRYLRIADVYVSTSLSDAGIAASTAEAMACNVPVVVTNSGENSKWIDDGQNGLLVPIKNPQVLAEKIIYLLNNEDKASRLARLGRQTIVERNDYRREMMKMHEIYSALIKGNK